MARMLTPDEREFLRLLREEKGPREIAQVLGIDHAEASNRLRDLLIKFQAHNRAELLEKAPR
jgi:DNA-binding CsgD family transcriptional regulator